MGHFGQETQGLKLITVNKDELINYIEKNLENHKIEFEESMEGFFDVAEKELKFRLKTLKKGLVPRDLLFDVPRSHETEYIDIIDMLKMSVDDELDITYEQFKRYVKDDWDWSKSFKTLHSVYNN